MNNDYIVVKNSDLQKLTEEVNQKRKEGYLTCGGIVILPMIAMSAVSQFYQAMEKPYETIALAEEMKGMKIEGMGISFIGRFKDEPKGNTWYGLPSDLNQYLNQSYCVIRGTTDHLEPDKDYRVTITFEEVKK